MNGMAYAYVVYLGITIGITIWVARTLRRNGLVFIAKNEAEKPLAEALSHLLIVGFYLINFGVITFAMKSNDKVIDVQTGIELLSTKVGVILVAVGGMHFLFLMIFSGMKRANDEQRALEALRIPTNELVPTGSAG